MRTRLNAGFTLLEMVVAIVVIAILMAMAAPLIVHLVDSYTASAEGADLASAVGPAMWQMQWDSRNASSMTVNAPCTLQLTQGVGTYLNGNYISGQTIDYLYSAGEIFRTLQGGTAQLLIAHLTVPSGVCPFVYVKGTGGRRVSYGFVYTGPSGQGNLTVEGALSAYGY